ncbi:MAG: HlyD family secretion protein [Kordiimonas sp.]|nr:HlyD family secretion protein [Kordiimonas sp.]|tara:strand:- start:3122 stop:4183 length:1062 start_codon:yes stop_codon:yes gene_type:complete
MKKYLMILLSLAFCWVISISPAVFAEGDRTHNHNELTESHDVENHTHEHKYEDESHHDEAEDARGDGHENHEDEHGDHEDEDAKAEISPESAKKMNIVIEAVTPATIEKTVPLTGRITLNRNTKSDVRARFQGIVRDVKVNLGQSVTKGQALAVVEANESLQNYTITSPINGVVLERNTNVGDVTGDKSLFVVADLSNVWAKFHIFPRDDAFVKSGQKIAVHTLEGGEGAIGKLDMLFPTADELTQTQVGIVVLPNPDFRWKPGMTVEGDVTVATTETPIAVKNSALQKMEELGDVIFIKEGNSYLPRPVRVGSKDGSFTEILQGVKPRELYVSEGSFIVKSDIMKSTAEHAH